MNHSPMRWSAVFAVAALQACSPASSTTPVVSIDSAPVRLGRGPVGAHLQQPTDFAVRLSSPRSRSDEVGPQPGPAARDERPGPFGPTSTITPACRSSSLTGASPEQVVTFLEAHSIDCLYFLFIGSEAMGSVYTDTNVSAVADRLATLAPQYDGTAAAPYGQLMYFLQAAYFFDFFYGAMAPFDPANVAAPVQAALSAIEARPALLVNGAVQGELLTRWLNAADAAAMPVLATTKTVLATFRADLTRADLRQQGDALSAALSHAQRMVGIDVMRPFIDAALIAELRWWSTNTELLGPRHWMADLATFALNGMYAHGALPAALRTAAYEALSATASAQPAMSTPNLWAVKGLTYNTDCRALVAGGQVCRRATFDALRAQLFPQRYTFDDGLLVIDTGIPSGDVMTLYRAIKVVSAQFFRVAETQTAVAGDPHAILKVQIYPTKTAYVDYHPILTGLPVANGGIYTDDVGVFYTYQRLPTESAFTLEELTRHEYTHYLVSRYVVPGEWGKIPLYADERFTWFDEGFAELMVASNKTAIPPRRKTVAYVATDLFPRMTVSEVVHARSGDFRYYYYSALLHSYLYTYDKATLRTLLSASRAASPSAFDAAVAAFESNPANQAAYASYVNTLVQNLGTLNDASTPSAPPTLQDGIAAIQTGFRAAPAGVYGDCRVTAWSSVSRFSCFGALNSPLIPSRNPITAWNSFNAAVNGIVSTLQTSPVSNLRDTQCGFGEMTWVPYGSSFFATTRYQCDGPMPLQAAPALTYGVTDQADFRSTRLGAPAACSAAAGQADCVVPISTAVRPAATTTGDLRVELDAAVAMLRADVQPLRPYYYRDLACETDPASVQRLAYGTGVYLAGRARCTDVHEPPPPVPGVTDQADFRSQRLGAYTTCTVAGAVVTCTAQLSGPVQPMTMGFAELAADLEDSLYAMRTDLIDLRPDYYRTLECAFDPATLIVYPYGDSQFINGVWTCTVTH